METSNAAAATAPFDENQGRRCRHSHIFTARQNVNLKNEVSHCHYHKRPLSMSSLRNFITDIDTIPKRCASSTAKTDIDARKRRERNFELRNPRPLGHFDMPTNRGFLIQSSRTSFASARLGRRENSTSTPANLRTEISTAKICLQAL